MSYLVANPEDRFSHDVAQMTVKLACSNFTTLFVLQKMALENSVDPHEPQQDKTNKVTMRQAKTQIKLGDAQSDQSLRFELNG